MMLKEGLSADRILVEVEVQSKWDLLERMAALVMNSPVFEPLNVKPAVVRDAIMAREKEVSTAVGDGCAFPHARVAGLEAPALCLAILNPPIDFDAHDGGPVGIVCMVIVPEDNPTITLKVMAELSTLLLSRSNRRFFMHVDDPERLCAFIAEHATGQDLPIMAKDIMRNRYVDIHPETPLALVTKIMQQYRIEAIAVIEQDETMVGQITCDELFQFGMPDFFTQLRTISFIREFDPFEKYFKHAQGAVARDVMSDSFSALSEEATLLEVVFELAVRRFPVVNVLRKGKHVGAIDRNAVLQYVINF